MIPSLNERKALGTQFTGDVARMQRCMQAIQRNVEDDEVIFAWADYSGTVCASWLQLPEDDTELRAILLKHLPSAPLTGIAMLEDAGDGSGDRIITLPPELLKQLDWKEGDTLWFSRIGDEITLRKAD